jgi:hypothetical protein
VIRSRAHENCIRPQHRRESESINGFCRQRNRLTGVPFASHDPFIQPTNRMVDSQACDSPLWGSHSRLDFRIDDGLSHHACSSEHFAIPANPLTADPTSLFLRQHPFCHSFLPRPRHHVVDAALHLAVSRAMARLAERNWDECMSLLSHACERARKQQ